MQNGRLRDVLSELRHAGITHVVVPAGRELEGDLEKVHDDGMYQVYRLTGVTDAK
jgi:hypothetical protein